MFVPRNVAAGFAEPRDGQGHAAGIIFVAPDGDILLLRRSSTEPNWGGHWALPGGKGDDGETPEQIAEREAREEIGGIPKGARKLLDSRLTPSGMAFHTFVAAVDKFVPVLNDEHTGYAWAPLHQLPGPMHPAVKAALEEHLGIDAAVPETLPERGADLAKWAAADDAALASDSMALDRGSVRTYDKDGRLHVVITNISKAAINPYVGREIPDFEALGLQPNRIYQLLRDPDELAKAAPTFNNVPLLSKHQPVNAEDHKPDLVIGSTGTDAEFAAPFLRNSLVVWAKAGIEAIESELQRELSSAYRYRADMTPGTYDGAPYDGVMRDIVGNHVALVREGRAGPDVVVGDSNGEITMNKVLTRKAVMLSGALAVYLRPKLAQDAKIDVSDLLDGVTAANLKDKKAGIVTGLKTLTKDKLAQDANLDDVVGFIDALEPVAVAEGADIDPSSGLPMAAMSPAANDDDPIAKIKEFLAGKLNDTDMAAFDALCAGGRAMDEEDDDTDKDKKNAKTVSKPAMDAAIATAIETTRADILKSQREIRDAEKAVRPYIGELAIAHDSADEVYRTALTTLGVDIKGMHPSAFPAVLKMQPVPGAKPARTRIAEDGATVTDFSKRFPDTTRIGTA